MQRIFIFCSIILLCTGCGPAHKLKKAARLVREAVEKGAKTDTLTTTKVDTASIQGFRDSFSTNLHVNPVFLVKACQELQQATRPGRKQRAVEGIQRIACPEVTIDTTYKLTMKAQGKEYTLPIRVQFSTRLGKTSYSIEGGKLVVPIVTEKNKVSISSPGYTWWDIAKWCLLTAVVAALLSRLLWK